MRGKKAAALGICLSVMATMTGCSFNGTMQKFVGKLSGDLKSDQEDVVSSSVGSAVSPLTVDPNMELPRFESAEDVKYAVMPNDPLTLTVKASVSAGDPVTYQWYSSKVHTSGGGTLVEGETGDSLTVDTSAPMDMHYYAVATYTKDGKSRQSVSPVFEVEVWQEGIWTKDEASGGSRYVVQADGSYPVSVSLTIKGVSYFFNEDGYAVDDKGKILNVGSDGKIAADPTPTPTPSPAPTEAPKESEETAAETEAE